MIAASASASMGAVMSARSSASSASRSIVRSAKASASGSSVARAAGSSGVSIGAGPAAMIAAASAGAGASSGTAALGSAAAASATTAGAAASSAMTAGASATGAMGTGVMDAVGVGSAIARAAANGALSSVPSASRRARRATGAVPNIAARRADASSIETALGAASASSSAAKPGLDVAAHHLAGAGHRVRDIEPILEEREHCRVVDGGGRRLRREQRRDTGAGAPRRLGRQRRGRVDRRGHGDRERGQLVGRQRRGRRDRRGRGPRRAPRQGHLDHGRLARHGHGHGRWRLGWRGGGRRRDRRRGGGRRRDRRRGRRGRHARAPWPCARRGLRGRRGAHRGRRVRTRWLCGARGRRGAHGGRDVAGRLRRPAPEVRGLDRRRVLVPGRPRHRVVVVDRHGQPALAIDEAVALAELEDLHQHLARLLGHAGELDAHAVHRARAARIVVADPADDAEADDHRPVVGEPQLEPDLGVDGLGRAGADEQARARDVGRELLDERVEIVVAQLDAQHRRCLLGACRVVGHRGDGRAGRALIIRLVAARRQTPRPVLDQDRRRSSAATAPF